MPQAKGDVMATHEQIALSMSGPLALALFDEIEYGLIVCDQHGALRFANQAARTEIASQKLLLCSGDRLRGVAGSAEDLAIALRHAVLRGRRCLLRLACGGDQLIVSVLPFEPQGASPREALVILGRRQPCSELGLEMLAACYRLTHAERRVLAALVRQATPREIATTHGVKISTVRTHISAIRAKFGTRSVEALLLRTAQMPPVASALRLTKPERLQADDAPLLRAA